MEYATRHTNYHYLNQPYTQHNNSLRKPTIPTPRYTQTFTIQKTNTTLTLPETVLLKTPIEIKATVTDTEGSTINNGKVIFTIDDEVIAEVDITEGIATTTITFTEEKNITIKASYQRNRDYNPSSAETKITIQKPESHTNTTDTNPTLGDTTTLTATFYDENDEIITEGTVIFRINGKTLRDNEGNVIYAEIIDGQATIPDVNITKEWLKPDTTIQAIYVGNGDNEAIFTKATTINVTKPEATITLEAPTTTTIGETITLTANVTDRDKAINSGRVVFKLNGKTLKDDDGKALYVNVENGVATTTYTIPAKTKAKTYNLTAVFTDSATRQESNSLFLIKSV